MKTKPPSPARISPRRLLIGVLSTLCLLAVIGFAVLVYASGPPRQPNKSIASRTVQVEGTPQSSDGVWRFTGDAAIKSKEEQNAGPRAYRAVKLSRSALTTVLRQAPLEFSAASREQRAIISLPAADGGFSRFAIVESPIMAPELAARFPEIKTYSGQGIDDPSATTRFDWTPTGFHAIVLSEKGTVLIEPQNVDDTENHIVYFQHEVTGATFECDVTGADQEEAIARAQLTKKSGGLSPAVVSGTTLRTYRLAAAATAEYTAAYGGGTVSGGLNAITTTVNLVDAIYEREVAIRLTLVAGETSIIFTDTNTDGYTSDNVNTMFNENQGRVDSLIGSANYDIGHVFDGRLLGGGSFSWQGVAAIGSVCAGGSKARGVDIFRSVSPTSVFAYYSAAHEMGHQFGATHTFNANTGSCSTQRTGSSAYEPVNGSTIMAYRFACAPEDLMSLDTYFHNHSIEQIVNYTTSGGGSGCAVPSATGNTPPLVNAGASYTIPMGTPFTLTASGSDPDGDSLTFGWEEFDLGAAAPPDTDDGSRPIFRSFAPVSGPSRTFPRLQDVLSRSATFGESMPTTTRTMNFRVTARDNRTGGGGVNSAATTVNVNSGAGPFTVDQPSSSATWGVGSAQTVNWSVANTNNSPVACANVKITLSTDAGNSFPIVLANSTPNDGVETVTIPGTPTSNARIKVEGEGNIFFNISQSFVINGSVNSVPTITGFSPPSGAPGASVTINGTNFISPSSVNFNGVSASFVLNSTTQIVAIVPGGASTGPITVVTASGTAASGSNFVVPSAVVQLSASTNSVTEGTAAVDVVVNRTGDLSSASTVDYTTSDSGAVSCSTVNGASSSRCDYLTTLGTLHFAAGEGSKTISIPIVDDSYTEGSETFAFTLSNPTGAILGSPAVATITINDNGDTNGANAIDVSSFFVRQHYYDFLNRQPDSGGLAFWTGEIDGCSPQPQCTEIKRINVSAAFYISIEFQKTGYLVERIYKASYADANGASSTPPAHQLLVPIVRLNEFLADTQQIGQGVVVNQTGWEQVLENNKQAFVAEFVQRARFITALPLTMTAAQFVDALNTNARDVDGIKPLSQSERDQLVSDLTGGTKTRAQVLRAVAEDGDFNTAESNRAFVLMQYFGYLRRNPNDPPELTLDYAGYEFWLNKLNQFNGNFVNAEMVKAFLLSTEYRQRFGRP